MPTAQFQIASADGTRQRVDADHPLPVAILQDSSTEVGFHNVCGTVAALGVTQLLGAPGVNQRIVVAAFVIQLEAAVATTIVLRDGGNDRWRVHCQNQGDGLALTFSTGWGWRLTPNSPLNVSLSGANQCNYSVQYYTEGIA